jgi:phage tail-like protein
MATGERKDPFRSYNFIVEIDGITRAGFRECSGLDSSQDPIDYREGNQRQTTRKLPGLRKHSNIVLKWGMVTDDKELWDWRQTVIDGNVSRRNGSIVLVDDQGNEKARWNFVDGWPSKWTGPGLNATGNEVALETLEIVHEGLVRA